MKTKVSVVGAGVGGLATALRLANLGYQVSVYEKLSRCGGRANIIEEAGFKIDTGPSFVLMPDLFSEVFSSVGEDINSHLKLKALDTSYKIFYPDSTTLSIFRDSEKTKEELEKIEPGSSKAYEYFLAETADYYKTVKPLLYQCFTSSQLLNPKYWKLLVKLNPFKTYWQIAKKYFKSDKICYAFTFEAMFIGVSPFNTPSFYSIITYADHIQKIHHPVGGMYTIPTALENLCRQKGVSFNYNCPVRKIIKRKDGLALHTESESINTDKVVINADYSFARSQLLGDKIPDYRYSCSVYLIYLGLNKKVDNLEHHNLFFSSDLRKNLKQIFKSDEVPRDPSFYIHVPTVTDSSLAPEGKEIVYILIPVPNLKNNPERKFAPYAEGLRGFVFDKVKKQTGVDLSDFIEFEQSFYPGDFKERYNIKHCATFGLAHTLYQSAFFRPPNLYEKNKNIYFVGASTQPGGGLPPVIASSKIVSDAIAAGER
ncbi:MAG: phytoene desaturase [Candidatus Omnitrophica bacterium]|nr:phytoene desaturase [Candidatus Omnitrophota bacterium]MBD3268842.1 phytoene desaturase [Candidatus Omnitrophota bacterium]